MSYEVGIGPSWQVRRPDRDFLRSPCEWGARWRRSQTAGGSGAKAGAKRKEQLTLERTVPALLPTTLAAPSAPVAGLLDGMPRQRERGETGAAETPVTPLATAAPDTRLRVLRLRRLFPTPAGTPFTFVYGAVLAVVSLVAAHLDPALVHTLHQGSSTDVAHLVRTPVLVLVASALWIAGGILSPYAVALLFVLTALERRIGGRAHGRCLPARACRGDPRHGGPHRTRASWSGICPPAHCTVSTTESASASPRASARWRGCSGRGCVGRCSPCSAGRWSGPDRVHRPDDRLGPSDRPDDRRRDLAVGAQGPATRANHGKSPSD